MKYIILMIAFSLNLLFAINVTVAGEKRFTKYLKNLESNQLKFIIRDKNSSLEAFEEIQSSIVNIAIVRGDILVDNMASRNYFKENSFQDFKILSKLKENFSTYLYLVSKDKVTNAYEVLNPDAITKKRKSIAIGVLKDLSNIYLEDIAKSVNANYRFRYKSYSTKESLLRVLDNSVDAAYLFLSPELVSEARKNKLILGRMVNPVNVKTENFAKKITEQKAFNLVSNGIRVDNYLVVSSSISDVELNALVLALKKDTNLVTNVKKEFGEVDSRIASMAIKIDIQKSQAAADAKVKQEECKEAKNKALEVATPKVSLALYTKDATKKIKLVLSSVNRAEELNFFKPQLDALLLTVNESNKEANKLMKNISKEVSNCNAAQVSAVLIALNIKVGEIQNSRKELALIQSEILKKGQLDKESLAREEKSLIKEAEALAKSEEKLFAMELEKEQRALEAVLEQEERAEEKALVKEEESGFFSALKGLIN